MDQGINGGTVSGVLQAHTEFKFVKKVSMMKRLRNKTPVSDKGTRERCLFRHSRSVCRSRESGNQNAGKPQAESA